MRGTPPRPRVSRSAPTCASSSDLLLVRCVWGLDLVGVLGAPRDVDALTLRRRRPVVRAHDRQALASLGVEKHADERADEDDVEDGCALAVPVQLDPLGPHRDAAAVALE